MVGKGHQGIESAYRLRMNLFAKKISKEFPNLGFALLIFKFENGEDEQRRMNYISNAERSDMIVAMKEFIARHENRIADSNKTH